MTVLLVLFSLLLRMLATISCLVAAAASPLYPFLSYEALVVLIPMVMGLLSPRGSQITTTIVAGTGLCDGLDARAMLACLDFFFYFFFDQG